MKRPDHMKTFDDPLLDGLRDSRASSTRRPADSLNSELPPLSSGGGGSSGVQIILGVGLLLVLGILGHFLYRAQGQIAELDGQLTLDRDQLTAVSGALKGSQGEIDRLSTGLNQSQTRLQQQNRDLDRYKGLYENLKDDQDQQTRELAALNLEKASQTDVAALRDQASSLQNEVKAVNSSVDALQQTTGANAARLTENGNRIEQASTRIDQVESSSNTNAAKIAAVRKSLQRDYYNFELQEKGAYMKVQDIHFRLKDIDFEKRLYDLDVLTDSKVIRKRDQAINEPIYFFRKGEKRPYEVVVTRIDRDLVVGYLAVPTT